MREPSLSQHDLRDLLEEHLLPDEKVGWAGRPHGLAYGLAGAQEWAWLLPGLPLAALLVALLRGGSGMSVAQPVLQAALLSTVLLALTFASSFFQARRTVYGVTNLRVIIIMPVIAGFGPRPINSYSYHHLGVVECEAVYRDIGNVIFKRQPALQATSRRAGSAVEKIGFFAVPKACELVDAIARFSYIANRDGSG